MLTIQNLNKLNHKTLGKKNFYVARVRETFDLDMGNRQSINHKYIFELSNMKYTITITLDREAHLIQHEMIYVLTSSTGHKLYLLKNEIRNMDIFIDKLRLVGLSK
jgi:hypothetical protein